MTQTHQRAPTMAKAITTPTTAIAGHQEHSDAGQAEILDLDAEVLAEHIASITAWLPLKSEPRHDQWTWAAARARAPSRSSRRFPDAHVTAVDTWPGTSSSCARSQW
ncbi:hypothetical protein SANTM175S_07005 [Streptomyces antimycoticus]